MLTIEQLRSLPDLRAKFQATTGLTWDPTSLEDEDFLKAIQWLFPKGAGFDAEHITFDKEVIEEIGGDTSDEYYSGEDSEGGEGGTEPEPTPGPGPDDQNTPPAPQTVATLDTSNKTDEEIQEMLAPYDILPNDATAADAAAAVAAADADHDGKVNIVSTPVQDEEGKYMIDSDGNYTTVYTVEEDTED